MSIARAHPGRGLPVAYMAAIRRGGTVAGDGALGTKWSGLVVRAMGHSRRSSGAARLNTLRALPMKAPVWRARMYQQGSQFHPPAEALDAETRVPP